MKTKAKKGQAGAARARGERRAVRGAAETAQDISARHYHGTWVFLTETFGKSIAAWDDDIQDAEPRRGRQETPDQPSC